MSFRLRCHLAFLPLFLGFSVAAATLAYLIEWRQVRWGLDSQSQSDALCLVAFLNPPLPGEAFPDLSTRVLAASRLSRGAGGLTIAWFEPHGREWRTRLLASTSGLLMPPVPESRLVARIRSGASATVLRPRFGADYDEVIGYAGLYNESGEVRAIVGVTAKDNGSRAERRRLWRTIMWLALGGLVGGIFAAEVVSQWVRHDLKTVTRRARGITRGQFDPEWQPSIVGELDDLAHALGSIDQILLESARQTRRQFLHHQREAAEGEIARSCYGLGNDEASFSAPGAPRGLVQRVGGGDIDDFCAAHRGPHGWHVLIGRLAVPASGPSAVQRSVRAEAARDYAMGLLESHPAAEVWPRVHAVFPLTRAVLVSLPFDGERDLVTHGDVPQPIEPVVVFSPPAPDDRPLVATRSERQPNAVDNGTASSAPVARRCPALVLGTLSQALMTAARDYVRNAPDVAHAVAELPVLFEGRDAGLLVVLLLS